MGDPENLKVKEYHRLISDNIKPRDYPWRFIDDAYKVLVSEFMLHRTRAKQVVPVYEEFIDKYPSIEDFIREDEGVILNQIKTLGLFWRIQGMVKAVKQFYENHGRIPLEYDLLIDTEGIGPYIAGAVMCFAGNKPEPLIDTNTVRVIGRVFGLDLEGEARRRKEIREMIKTTTPLENPKEYYYCVIDLAHEICHYRQPACYRCPLTTICEFANNAEKNTIDYRKE